MCVHEFEGAMFEMKSSMMRTIWGGRQSVGSRCLYFFMKWVTVAMPSSCWMFVYKDVASALTKRPLDGRDGILSTRLRKCFVSLMCDGRF